MPNVMSIIELQQQTVLVSFSGSGRSQLPGSQIGEEEIESNSPHYNGPQNDEHDQ